MSNATFRDSHGGDGSVDQEVIEVNPGNPHFVAMGVYPDSEVEPNFGLDFDPNMKDKMDCAPLRFDIPGESSYLMIYQLHNYGDKPCTVSIKRMHHAQNGRGR